MKSYTIFIMGIKILRSIGGFPYLIKHAPECKSNEGTNKLICYWKNYKFKWNTYLFIFSCFVTIFMSCNILLYMIQQFSIVLSMSGSKTGAIAIRMLGLAISLQMLSLRINISFKSSYLNFIIQHMCNIVVYRSSHLKLSLFLFLNILTNIFLMIFSIQFQTVFDTILNTSAFMISGLTEFALLILYCGICDSVTSQLRKLARQWKCSQVVS